MDTVGLKNDDFFLLGGSHPDVFNGILYLNRSYIVHFEVWLDNLFGGLPVISDKERQMQSFFGGDGWAFFDGDAWMIMGVP